MHTTSLAPNKSQPDSIPASGLSFADMTSRVRRPNKSRSRAQSKASPAHNTPSGDPHKIPKSTARLLDWCPTARRANSTEFYFRRARFIPTAPTTRQIHTIPDDTRHIPAHRRTRPNLMDGANRMRPRRARFTPYPNATSTEFYFTFTPYPTKRDDCDPISAYQMDGVNMNPMIHTIPDKTRYIYAHRRPRPNSTSGAGQLRSGRRANPPQTDSYHTALTTRQIHTIPKRDLDRTLLHLLNASSAHGHADETRQIDTISPRFGGRPRPRSVSSRALDNSTEDVPGDASGRP
ncbi:hypothetical protein EXIGLDRAFT_769515 [Exidia glandulosa HHB12029]|uniref:Uncharacterized protein n=1 Tax=Exidia glandulosa HHB12029 TaxID=1314781 RepID=A0A165HDY3_EXIGL|nr:hypothetical protein EXIGLDRAFT_769515 [Exidia glandulosa HHB12029]